MPIGQQIAQLRKARHLQQQEVAAAVGVAPSMMSMIERGQRAPSTITLLRLARALQVSIETLSPELAELVNAEAATSAA